MAKKNSTLKQLRPLMAKRLKPEAFFSLFFFSSPFFLSLSCSFNGIEALASTFSELPQHVFILHLYLGYLVNSLFSRPTDLENL